MKIRNKIISAIMAMAMTMSLVATVSFAAAGVDGEISVRASKTVDVVPGEEVTVTVKFETNPGLQLINLTANADEGLNLIGAADCGMTFQNRFFANYSGSALSTNYSNAYTIFYNDSGSQADNTLAEDLCTLTYKVADNAATGAYTVEVVATEIKNMNKEVLDFGDASVTINVVAPEQTKDESFLTTVKYDASKTGVKFNVEDKAVVGRTASKEISYLAFVNAQVEAVENIVVGLTITDAPKTADLEVTAELY